MQKCVCGFFFVYKRKKTTTRMMQSFPGLVNILNGLILSTLNKISGLTSKKQSVKTPKLQRKFPEVIVDSIFAVNL
jgi:hypothetical protein